MSERVLTEAAPDAAGLADTFEIAAFRAGVRLPPGDAGRTARAVLRGFGPVASAGPIDAHFALTEVTDVQSGQRAFVVESGGVVTNRETDLGIALNHLEWQLVTAALAFRKDLFHIHGSALCLPAARAGIALVGATGRGKTTLTFGLLTSGFTVYSDDVILLDPASLMLRPLRRAFHIQDDTWRLLEPLAGPLARDGDVPSGFFVPPQWADAPVPLRWLLFVEYRPQQTPELIPMSPTESAAAILGQTLTLERASRLALDTTSRLVGQAECYRFRCGDLKESVAVVQQLVAAR